MLQNRRVSEQNTSLDQNNKLTAWHGTGGDQIPCSERCLQKVHDTAFTEAGGESRFSAMGSGKTAKVFALCNLKKGVCVVVGGDSDSCCIINMFALVTAGATLVNSFL